MPALWEQNENQNDKSTLTWLVNKESGHRRKSKSKDMNNNIENSSTGSAIYERRAKAAYARREQKLRRLADKQGFRVTKSRVRDPWNLLFGAYYLTDKYSGVLYGQPGLDLSTLDEIEEFLRED